MDQTFEAVVAKFGKRLPVRELPPALEIVRERKLPAPYLIRFGISDTNRIALRDNKNGRCSFELRDGTGEQAEVQRKTGAYLLVGAFACPWDEDGPLYRLDLLVRPLAVVEGQTKDQLKLAIPKLEVIALRYGNVIARKP